MIEAGSGKELSEQENVHDNQELKIK